MALGDFDWANNELGEELGSAWENDEFGQILLHMALYDENMSPDLKANAYDAFVGFTDDFGVYHPGYMETEYDFDFEDNFDWEAYREWYG